MASTTASRRVAFAVTAALAAAGVLGGCASHHPPSSSTGTTTAPSTTSGPAPSTSAAGRSPHQTITVTPSTGLTNGEKVSVTAKGFKPGESDLVAVECANKGSATGAGDCNLTGIVPATANSAGVVSLQMTVVQGPFGTNHIVCSISQPCEISVSQETLNPTEEADTPISFGS